jgi:hypothetical protein
MEIKNLLIKIYGILEISESIEEAKSKIKELEETEKKTTKK